MALADPCLLWRPYGRSYEDGTDALEDSQRIRPCPIRNERDDCWRPPPVCKPPTVLPVTGLCNPADVAVSSIGNIYLTDAGTNRVVKPAVGQPSLKCSAPHMF